ARVRAPAVTYPSISDPPAGPPKEGLDAKDIIFMIIATFAQGHRTAHATGVEIWMRLHPAMKNGERKGIPFRTATMSKQIVAQVREALFAKELRSGDFLGTEKDLAERFGVSRIVARDALRTLEAQGVVEIKVGSGGGARIARGNARLFAEALAVQLDLAGVSVG